MLSLLHFFQTQLVTGWSLSTGVLLYLLYGLYRTELSKLAAAAYSSLSHSAWAMALAWIVIACSTGNGGFLNKFLSATCLYPFSRVTYCAYLVHPIVIRAYALSSDTPLHMDVDSMVSFRLFSRNLHRNPTFTSAGNHLLRTNGCIIPPVVRRLALVRSTSLRTSQNLVKAQRPQRQPQLIKS